MEESVSAGLSLHRVTFCFLDVETTGLAPGYGDRICEVACLRWRDGTPLESFSSLVNPGRPISPGAAAVNGITNAMVKHAPCFGEIAPALMGMLDEAVIVCHNAPFDLGFIGIQLAELGLPPPPHPVLCTLALARRQYRFPSYSLGNLARCLGLEVAGEHRAMADVRLTQGVFSACLHDLQQQGVTTLGQLVELQGGPLPLSAPHPAALPPLLEEAVRRRRPLRLKYHPLWGRETTRIVEPIEITAYRRHLYLSAFCHLRRQRRTFRLDRITGMEVCPLRGEPFG